MSLAEEGRAPICYNVLARFRAFVGAHTCWDANSQRAQGLHFFNYTLAAKDLKQLMMRNNGAEDNGGQRGRTSHGFRIGNPLTSHGGTRGTTSSSYGFWSWRRTHSRGPRGTTGDHKPEGSTGDHEPEGTTGDHRGPQARATNSGSGAALTRGDHGGPRGTTSSRGPRGTMGAHKLELRIQDLALHSLEGTMGKSWITTNACASG